MLLLYVDMLGIKARWRDQGLDGALAGFELFDEVVHSGLRAVPQPELVWGGIDSDAAALVFEIPEHAFIAADAMFNAAFANRAQDPDRRMWIRGVVIHSPGHDLREAVALHRPFAHLRVARHSPSLLRAIAAEQSGFKGMRLLVDRDVLSRPLTRALALNMEGQHFSRFCRLKFSGYPGDADDDQWLDYLWMAAETSEDWNRQQARIRDRLRWSAVSAEEFLQAAATRLAFDECEGLLHGHRSRRGTG